MANERSGDEPLSASVGEQLQGKQALDQRLEAERQASGRAGARAKRRKAKEREEVAKHLGGAGSPEGGRVARTAARLRGRASAWLREWGRVLALPVAAVGGLVLGLRAGPKRKGVPVVIPVLAGWLVWRRLAHAR